jgi:hypothetical protein
MLGPKSEHPLASVVAVTVRPVPTETRAVESRQALETALFSLGVVQKDHDGLRTVDAVRGLANKAENV